MGTMETCRITKKAEGVSAKCECGCGATVRRRFLPGHDAKLKGALKAGLRSADWRTRQASADRLADLGWAHHADLAALRQIAMRDTRGMVRQLTSEVEVWQVDADHQHHCNRRCRRLTATARQHGQLGRLSRLAADSAVRLVQNTPELTADLERSWDLCPDCTTDTTRDVRAEKARMAQLAVAA